jgi:hypothetical protein
VRRGLNHQPVRRASISCHCALGGYGRCFTPCRWTERCGGIVQGSTVAPAPPSRSLQADFNGDGADDLAVGVPGESVGSIFAAGAVNVLYGSATGLSGTGRQLFTQVSSAAETDDTIGFALASGDFNTDTFADLAVGARSRTPAASPTPGRSASCPARRPV